MWVSELSEDYRLVRLNLGTDGRLDAIVSVPLERWILEYQGMTFEKQDAKFYIGNWNQALITSGEFRFNVLDSAATEIEGFTNYAVWKNISTTITDANTIVFFDGSTESAGSTAHSARWLVSKYTYDELLAMVGDSTTGYLESETQDISPGFDAGVDYPVNETLFLLNFDNVVDYDVQKQTVVSTTLNLNNLADVTNVLPEANHVIEYNAETEQYENKTSLMGKKLTVEDGLLTFKNARRVTPELYEFIRPAENLFFKKSASPVYVGFDGSSASAGSARGFVYTGGTRNALILCDSVGRRIQGVDARTIMYNEQLGVWHVYDTQADTSDLNVDDTQALWNHRSVAKTWTNDIETLLWMNALGFTMNDPDEFTGFPAIMTGLTASDVYVLKPSETSEDHENIATTISLKDLADVEIAGMVFGGIIYDLLPVYSHLEDLDVADVTSVESSRVYYNATLDRTVMKQKLFSGAITADTIADSIFWISTPGKYGNDFISGDQISAFDITNLGIGTEDELAPQGSLTLPQNGHILKFDAAKQKFVATSHDSIMTSLSEPLVAGQTLVYNDLNDTWTNQDNTLINHADVSVQGTDLQTGTILSWDAQANQFVPVDGLQQQMAVANPQGGEVMEYNETTGVFENKLPVNSQRVVASDGLLTITRARNYAPAMIQTVLGTPRYFRKSSVPVYGVSNGRDSGGFQNKIVVGSTTTGKEYHSWIECNSQGMAITSWDPLGQAQAPLVIFYSESQQGWVYTFGHVDNFDNAAEFITNTVFLYGVDGVSEAEFLELSQGYFNFTLLQEIGFQSLNDPGTGLPEFAYDVTLGRNFTKDEVLVEMPESENTDIQDFISTKIELSNLYDVDTKVVIIDGHRFVQEHLLGMYVDENDQIQYDNYPPNAVIYYNSDLNWTLIKRRLITSAAPWTQADQLDWVILSGRFGNPFSYGMNVAASIVNSIPVTDYDLAYPETGSSTPSIHAALTWDGEKYRPSALSAVTADISSGTTGSVPTWNQADKRFELANPLPDATSGHILFAQNSTWGTAIHNLDTLMDVDVSSASEGQVLTFTNSTWTAVNLAEVSVPKIGELADVSADLQADGNILKFDSATEKWIASDIQSVVQDALPTATADGSILLYQTGEWIAGENEHSLAELLDVELDELDPPLDAEVLTYDASKAKWKSSPIADKTIGQLSDVDVNTDAPNVNDCLTWDGNNWVPVANEHTLDELLNIDMTVEPSNGQALVFESSSGKWKAKNQADGMALDTGIVVLDKHIVEWDSSQSLWKPVAHEHTLSDLIDVQFDSAPLDKEVLSYDSASGKWTTSTHAYALDSLENVRVTDAVEADFLRFIGTEWVASDANLNALTDVNVSDPLPLDKQSLIYNTISNKWEAGTPPSDLPNGSESGQILVWNQEMALWQVSSHTDQSATTLSDLLDTDLSGQTDKSVLGFDSSIGKWVPQIHSYSINDLEDVETPNASSLDFLRFDGTKWVPSVPILNDLEDISVSAPLDKQSLIYNTISNKWEAGDVIPEGVENGQILKWNQNTLEWTAANPDEIPTKLSELQDVQAAAHLDGAMLVWSAADQIWTPRNDVIPEIQLDSVESGQILVFDALTAAWKNSMIELGDLANVDLNSDSADVDDILTWDGAKWVPKIHQHSLESITNVDLTTEALHKEVLEFDASTGKWKASMHTYELGELTNVNLNVISGLKDKDFLIFDSVSNNWVASGVSIDILEDVDVMSTRPLHGQALIYDTNVNKFVPGEVAQSGAVIPNGLVDGQHLVWSQSSNLWVPTNHEDSPAISSLLELSDVSGSPENNHIIQYDGSEWKSQPLMIANAFDVDLSDPLDSHVLVWQSDRFVMSNGILPPFSDAVALPGQVLTFQEQSNSWTPTWLDMTNGDLVDYKLSSLTLTDDGILSSSVSATINTNSIYLTPSTIQDFTIDSTNDILTFVDRPSSIYYGSSTQLRLTLTGIWNGSLEASYAVGGVGQNYTLDADGKIIYEIDENTPNPLVFYMTTDQTQNFSLEIRPESELIFVPTTGNYHLEELQPFDNYNLKLRHGDINGIGYNAFVALNKTLSIVFWDENDTLTNRNYSVIGTNWAIVKGDVSSYADGENVDVDSIDLMGLLSHSGLLYPTPGVQVKYENYTFTDSNTLAVEFGLNKMKDVQISSVNQNDILKFDGSHFVNVPDTLASKSDVNVGNDLQIGNALVWSGAKWIPSNLPNFIGEPSDGQFYKFDAAQNSFVPHDPILSDLKNVDLTDAEDGSILQFQSSTQKWVAGPKPTDFVTTSIQIDDNGVISTIIEDRNEETLTF